MGICTLHLAPWMLGIFSLRASFDCALNYNFSLPEQVEGVEQTPRPYTFLRLNDHMSHCRYSGGIKSMNDWPTELIGTCESRGLVLTLSTFCGFPRERWVPTA